MAQTNTNIAELKNKVDFGIITIREDEFEAVLQRLLLDEIVVGRQRYAMSRLKTVSDDEYVIASVRCLEPGTGQAQDVARTMIDELNPQWVLLVGIAGSMPDYEHTLGDVILASRLHDFSVSAIIENTSQEVRQEFAIGGGPMHRDVQTLLAALPALNLVLDEWYAPSSLTVSRPIVRLGRNNFYGNTDWKKRVKECLNRYFGNANVRQHPKAFTGSIASSGTLLKDTQTASSWLRTSRDIKGMEMELAGVYQAASGYQKPVLAIRGISDVVGFKRSPEWTSYACHTAAAFLLALLRSRPIIPRESREPTKDELADSFAPLHQQVGVFKQRPSTPALVAKREQLFSNLLEVSYFPETLYSIGTSCKDAKSVWAILNNEVEEPPNDWFYRSKTLYAFHDFSDPIWKDVCEENTAEPQPTSHWSNSDDQDRTREFIELLGNCLREFGKKRDLRYVYKQKIGKETKKFKFLCYKPTTEYLGSPFLRSEDVIDAEKLIVSLKDKQTPLTEYLFAKLPTATQKLVERYSGIEDSSIQIALVNGFNEILKASLYNPKLFDGVHVRREASRLMESEPFARELFPTLNRMLLEDAYWGVLAKRVLVPRKVVVKSLVRSGPTQVFKAFLNRAGKFSYYRHHAFRPHFIKIESKWHLEITPTYHYTWNGYRVPFFYEDLIKGIKRLERSGAVFRQVMFWARVLQDNKLEFLDQRTYPYLRFGELLEFQSDYGLRDELWLNKEVLGAGVGTTPKKEAVAAGALADLITPTQYILSMKIELLQPDPDLEFGNGGRCVDMRFGIGHFGVFDFSDPDGPRQVKLGFVGTEETIGSLIEWIEKCKYEIPGKPSKQPKLYPPFPGYARNHSFHSTLVWNPNEFMTVTIPDAAKSGTFNEVVERVADLYVDQIDKLIEKSGADVVLCAPPIEHLKLVTHVAGMSEEEPATVASEDENAEEEETTWYEFHDVLKARSLHLRTPLQYVLPATYDESKSAAQKKLKNRDQQDEATRAWNIFTAIYYKARGIPWRMTRDDADVRTCYLGVSFFRTLDKERIYASSAQVFNERGEGVIVRGGLAYKHKNDRQIHLNSDGAYDLITLALEAFRGEHFHYPARVVIHKTSSFTNDEYEGFGRFLKEKGIGLVDFLYLHESFIRLYRQDTYPPLRGTLWHLEDRRAVLYTKGSVPFYETYPGTYPPKSLYMDCDYAQRPTKELARECMALSKMNWNNTRFDGQLPITLRAARQVGLILKHLEGAATEKISPSYRFYM